jgi:hypothetical protein
MPRPPAAFAILAFALACSGASADRGTDTAGVADIDLGPDGNGQSTEREGCVVADSTGGYTWRCRVGRHLVARVAPSFLPRDSSGSRVLQSLLVRYEGALAPARTDSLAMGEVMGELQPWDVSTADLDGDGWADLRLRHHYGIAANEGHYVWRWMPATRRFIEDSLLTEETNVQPDGTGCVRTFASIGHGGMDQVESRYCLERGGWIEVARREQQWSDSLEGAWETFLERRGDSLIVVREGVVKE